MDGKLEGIADIEDRLDSTEGAADDQRHYLLGIDTDNAGQAIVATGNPDTAEDVATYVPGTGAGLDGVGELMNRGDDMHRSSTEAGSESSSVITWVGYDAPQNVATEATSEQYAQGATADLSGFRDGLSASHEGPGKPNTTLFGHSYGSTTIGHTARDEDLDIDQMVFLGSPGVGVEHADELGIDPDDVYATTAQNDIIRATPTFFHEQQPIAEDFGAVNFASDPGDSGFLGRPTMAAHSQYWDDGNKSLDNMGRIIADEPLPSSQIGAPE